MGLRKSEMCRVRGSSRLCPISGRMLIAQWIRQRMSEDLVGF